MPGGADPGKAAVPCPAVWSVAALLATDTQLDNTTLIPDFSQIADEKAG